MTAIIVAMVLGIIVGCCNIFNYTVKKWLDHLSKLALFVMIWCLAAKIGCDKELVDQLGVLGARSVALALGAVAGSFVMVLGLGKIMHKTLALLLHEEVKQ